MYTEENLRMMTFSLSVFWTAKMKIMRWSLPEESLHLSSLINSEEESENFDTSKLKISEALSSDMLRPQTQDYRIKMM